jgi:hypothetical protein
MLRTAAKVITKIKARRTVHSGPDFFDPHQGSATTLGTYCTELDTDMMAQRTVVIVVDDDAGLLKSVARLLGPVDNLPNRIFCRWEDSPGDSQLIESQGD